MSVHSGMIFSAVEAIIQECLIFRSALYLYICSYISLATSTPSGYCYLYSVYFVLYLHLQRILHVCYYAALMCEISSQGVIQRLPI